MNARRKNEIFIFCANKKVTSRKENITNKEKSLYITRNISCEKLFQFVDIVLREIREKQCE